MVDVTLPGLLRTVTRILESESIPYMLTGSLAGAYYAAPRATQDVDLVVEASLDELSALADRLSTSGFYVSAEAVREAAERESQFNAIDPNTGWKVDFIVRKSRPFSVKEFERRRTANVLGIEIFLASPEDLVIAKLEWAKEGGSELQIRDVRSILRARGDRLDRTYVERWIAELDLSAPWREALEGLESDGSSDCGPPGPPLPSAAR